MPRIPDSIDRFSGVGKGDLDKRSDFKIRRKSPLWPKSTCCNAPAIKTQGKLICEDCKKFTTSNES